MDDRSEIMNLLSAYAHTVADGRWDDWAQLFCRNGELVFRGRTSRGTEELRAFIEASHRDRDHPKVLSSNVVVHIDGDRADALSDFCLIRSKDPTAYTIVNCGRYVDELTRTEDGWRFRQRTIQPMHSG
jgi:3-phenylpropionate/cinnamic acid dioxygenase small subunit